ncbi:ATP/GTP-binding protein [Nocardiopsis sp. CNR-923]|uniref:tetratricopeptide repeat protein n=1 Tax=Nocardiopsis sp. CNR-923 TaxID=1904965 RepID=UPI000961E2AA|nr:tetratricopeptide repeat protein [Nocardiopsis sp. CNR-923]OLT28207.1 ATP/GTP-binding protein [Nocardiopsis sp. CNR-923]
MASPPNAHENSSHGAVYGQMVQARDIHGGVTINVPTALPAPLADVSLDPPRLATAVRGRDDLLGTLGEAMTAGAPVPHVLTGPGGFGKTTVAAALAERARSDRWTVFWVRPGNVAASMVEVAVELGGSREEAERVRPARHQAARWVWRHLDKAPRPWLLVIDNADRPEELDPDNRVGDQLGWMRASPGGFVLVTSRVDDPVLWAPAKVHRISELDALSATAALTDHAGMPDLPGADILAERLGRVPLAVSLAGRILATHRVLFPNAHALLDRLDQNLGKLDQLAAPLVTGGDTDRRLLSGVWDLSLRLLAEKDAYAPRLLRLLAVLGTEALDVPLRRLPVSELADGLFEGMDETAMARAINALIIHGLVSATSKREETVLSLHPLVSESVRAGFGDKEAHLLDVAESLLDGRRGRDPALEAVAYAEVGRTGSRATGLVGSVEIRRMTKSYRAMTLAGNPEDAERHLRELVTNARASLGDAHPETLAARHTLADAVRAQDQFESAEDMYRAVTDDRAVALGPHHTDTLSSRHQVALMAYLRDDLDAAEEGLRAVWKIHVSLGAEESSNALFALGNLAHVQRRRGNFDAAEASLRSIREVRIRDLGEEHPDTLAVDFHLALVAYERGDHASAMRSFHHVALNRAAVLGEDHRLTEQAREWREKTVRQLRGA